MPRPAYRAIVVYYLSVVSFKPLQQRFIIRATKRWMRLLGWTKIESAPLGKLRRLLNFFQAQHRDVKLPRTILAARWDRELNVIDLHEWSHARPIRLGEAVAPQNLGPCAGYGQ